MRAMEQHIYTLKDRLLAAGRRLGASELATRPSEPPGVRAVPPELLRTPV